VSFVTHKGEKRAVSIFDLCPAADWIEREISDCYEVEWVNRAHEPLLIRAGAAQGVNLREED
jgi:Ni,Fe-hydrogenase III component G